VITVLLNPGAGGGADDQLPVLEKLFAAAGATARFLTIGPNFDMMAAVGAAISDGAESIVAAGGDGTVSSVAAAVVGSATPFGVLPMGTLNHFAKDLNVPLDLPTAITTVVAAHTTRVDVGEVNGRLFLNNSSIGLYPDIVVERERLRGEGRRKWVAAAIAAARIVRNGRNLVVRLTTGGVQERTRTPFLFIGNNEYQTQGLQIGGRQRIDCGKLYGYLAPRVHARELPKLFALAVLGRVRRVHSLASFAVTELQVDTPRRRRIRVALDGEVQVMTTPLHYRVHPRALMVIVPAH
jgi:diacylglycerol kinase family enzyme